MAVLNPNISHTMIEGGMFKAEVDAKKNYGRTNRLFERGRIR